MLSESTHLFYVPLEERRIPFISLNKFFSLFKNSYTVVLSIGWFVVMGGFFVWNGDDIHEGNLEKVRIEAKTLFKLNLVYHGGLY